MEEFIEIKLDNGTTNIIKPTKAFWEDDKKDKIKSLVYHIRRNTYGKTKY